MAITNGYATLDELKHQLDVQDVFDDTILEQNIEAASRQIDGWCGRSFYAATNQTRYFTADMSLTLFLDDDLVSVTTLKTDEDADRTYETTWDATDYDLDPADGPPYTRITVTPQGRYGFPRHSRGVQIVGTFGYTEVPVAITQACLILATRYFKRTDAPFGVAGSNDQGQLQTLPGMDPDIKQLIQHYRRMAALGIG